MLYTPTLSVVRLVLHFTPFHTINTYRAVMFVICKPPIDVYVLVTAYLERVERTKVTGFRFVFRTNDVLVSC